MKTLFTALLVCVLAVSLHAQFSSGSTGSDGALNLTTPGTVIFDPVAMGLNPAGDNVFNFTTINIASNVTLVMTADVLRNRPVIWLATGNVTIAGTIELSGANGATINSNNIGASRYPAMPGPGGFPGGVGAYQGSPATNGGGYGGGTTTTSNGGNATYLYYSDQLVPLFGGAGGAGAQIDNGPAGGNGGAGGGAIRIVSSTSITINSNGSILAEGGTGGYSPGSQPYYGGGGAGGAIHLIAPTVANSGTLNVSGGDGPAQGLAGSGVIKVNATTSTGFTNNNAVVGPLYNPPLPTYVPSVKVVSVNGTAAPNDVMASILAPDFTVSTSSAVSVNIAAQYVPVGTVVTLYLNSEQGGDQVVTCAALSGSLASSTATCSGVNFPQGVVTTTNIRAVW